MTQLGLFEETREESYQVEPTTTVKLGRRSALVPLKKRRREAMQQLREVLDQLEGKDVLVGSYFGAHNHFWIDSLLLRRLKVQWGLSHVGEPPSVLILWGTRNGRKQQHIRIFLDQLHDVRTQNYSDGKPYHLIDFWNGFGEYPIDQYRPKGYVSLQLRAARQ